MIINKTIKIKKKGNKNIRYYSDLGYDTNLDEFEIDINHLTNSSKYLVDIKCDFCEKIVSRMYYLYLKNISSNGLFACSPKCGKNKTLNTNLEKYGVEYPNQSELVRNKTKETNLERWGVDSPLKSEEIKDKKRKTNLERWGVEHTLQNKEIRDKIKKTLLEKYGVDHNFKSEIIIENRKETYLKNWGVDNPSKSEEIKDKKRETSIKNWGVDNPNKSEEIKEKKRETNIERLGVEYPMQNLDVREKSKNTLLEKWGVEHNSKLDFVKEGMKINNLEKWGVEYTLQNKEIRKNIKNTNLNKWGVEYYTKTQDYIDKVKITNLEKYGVEWVLKNKEIRDKIKETNKNKLGVDNPSKSDEIKEKKRETSIKNFGFPTSNQNESFRKKYFNISKDSSYIEYKGNSISIFKCNNGHNFEISYSNYHSRLKSKIPHCTICHPIGNSRSIKEDEVYNYISSIYNGEVVQSYRDGLEIDIYLPELKLGFEFNGLYWHSEEYKSKNYHREKTDYFSERGIRIIHIWEDDWDLKSDILKSQISHLLGYSERIMARKCTVRNIDIPYISSDFLNKNHIQGSDKSSIKLGLFSGDLLVSVMTFNNLEGRTKMEEGGWNLSRFCNLRGLSVVGAASKLLSYFIREWNPKRIVSYADYNWSIGNLYDKLGFSVVSISRPDYKYLYEGKRVHKSNFSKRKMKFSVTETEYMEEMGIHRVWDCGKVKLEKHLK